MERAPCAGSNGSVKKLCVLAPGLVLLLVLPACAISAEAKRPRKPYRNPTAGRELALQIRDMHQARVKRGIAYETVVGTTLRMDVYRPRAASAAALPAVLLGGPPAYRAGKDSGQKVGWSQLIAASGLAAVAFDIRSDNFQTTPFDPSHDVAAAIAYVRAHAAELGIDADRLCTLGFSLGTAPWHLWATMRDPQPYIRCNAVYYGPLDFHGVGFALDPSLADEFSALTYLTQRPAAVAPLLVAKAGRDRFAEINTSIDRFVTEARTLGAPVELLVHSTGPHGFDTWTGNTRAQAIIRRTLAFFRERLA
jgi:acetyl esterase/lipase